jgi:uncharacterized protein (DUF1501 family)
MTTNASRRQFLRASTGLAAAAASPLGGSTFNASVAMGLAGIGAAASLSAHAANTSGYKALVCLFMAGGSDQHNWIVPTDASSYADYAKVRADLAWPLAQLLPISSTTQGSGRTFGMPQELQPLQALYQGGQAAVVANVGTLERPTTKADYQNGLSLPAKLFSHNDQASTWQSLSPEGARSGWGGRMGDMLAAANQYPVFTAVSAAGNAVFLTGSTVTQYQVGATGPTPIKALGASWVNGSTTAGPLLAKVLKGSGSDLYQAEYARTVQRSIDTTSTLTSALATTAVAPLPTTAITLPASGSITLANDSLAKQLRIVAQMIAAGSSLGMRRQVFMVQIGGFDSHSNQMRDQPTLMARVAHSMGWFNSAVATLGLGNSVTLFTASEFGRTLVSNGDGSDHGWGSHQFVVGGAVKGKTILGNFPVTALGTSDEVGSGRLLPSTSVTQLAASLGGWMGLTEAEKLTVLPNLSSFGAAPVLF